MSDKDQRESIIQQAKVAALEAQIEALQERLTNEQQQKTWLKNEIKIFEEQIEISSLDNRRSRRYIVELEKQVDEGKGQKSRADSLEQSGKERSEDFFKLVQHVKNLEKEKAQLIETVRAEKSRDYVKEAQAIAATAIMERTAETFNHVRTREKLREMTEKANKLADRLSVLERYYAGKLTYWQRMQVFLKF